MSRTSRKMTWARGRKLVLVDIENVLGFVPEHEADVERARRVIQDAIGVEPHDHVVVGVCHRGAASAGYGWLGARLVVRSGPDGADLALLEVATESVASRFSRIVVVSGDHSFVDAIASLASEGVSTTVASRKVALSRRLRMAAQEVVYLPDSISSEEFEEAA